MARHVSWPLLRIPNALPYRCVLICSPDPFVSAYAVLLPLVLLGIACTSMWKRACIADGSHNSKAELTFGIADFICMLTSQATFCSLC